MKRIGTLCPSAPAREGALLIGVVEANGSVAFLPQPRVVNGSALRALKVGREPERRFRFASKCQRTRCLNWSSAGCGLIERIRDDLSSEEMTRARGGSCSIHASCVWYAQDGLDACTNCRFVVTKTDSD